MNIHRLYKNRSLSTCFSHNASRYISLTSRMETNTSLEAWKPMGGATNNCFFRNFSCSEQWLGVLCTGGTNKESFTSIDFQRQS